MFTVIVVSPEGARRIVRRGLGYDRADVAVITNITGDHIGTDGIDTIDDLIGVKALVAEEIKEYGHLVLNADDRNSAGVARRPAVRDREARPRLRLGSTPCRA